MTTFWRLLGGNIRQQTCLLSRADTAIHISCISVGTLVECGMMCMFLAVSAVSLLFISIYGLYCIWHLVPKVLNLQRDTWNCMSPLHPQLLYHVTHLIGKTIWICEVNFWKTGREWPILRRGETGREWPILRGEGVKLWLIMKRVSTCCEKGMVTVTEFGAWKFHLNPSSMIAPPQN
jgi:hypothetical protein